MKPRSAESIGSGRVSSPGNSYSRGNQAQPILFFDADCGLCTGLMELLNSANRCGRVRFEALSGDVARGLLQPRQLAQNSLWLRDSGRIHGRSTAVLRLMWLLGWPWMLAAPLLLVPRPLRDWVYGMIARRRHGLFRRGGPNS